MPYVAEKYINEKNGWESLIIDGDQWSCTHITKLCEKLSRNDQNAIDIIDYEYLSQNLTEITLI